MPTACDSLRPRLYHTKMSPLDKKILTYARGKRRRRRLVLRALSSYRIVIDCNRGGVLFFDVSTVRAQSRHTHTHTTHKHIYRVPIIITIRRATWGVAPISRPRAIPWWPILQYAIYNTSKPSQPTTYRLARSDLLESTQEKQLKKEPSMKNLKNKKNKKTWRDEVYNFFFRTNYRTLAIRPCWSTLQYFYSSTMRDEPAKVFLRNSLRIITITDRCRSPLFPLQHAGCTV